MNDQPTPPNSTGAGERPAGVRPEDLQTGALEQAASPEVAPTPGSSPAPQLSSVQIVPPAKLSADDVAAAIAATPVPGSPSGGVATPDAAGDVDVIEPEWVNKAEHEIAQHQGDPYGEEEAVEDLQQDYLKKRYGYNVADSNPDSSKPEGT